MVGDVLGPVGADLVAEAHAGSNDEMIRSEVHRAQVEFPAMSTVRRGINTVCGVARARVLTLRMPGMPDGQD
jgi:hypothetical protein